MGSTVAKTASTNHSIIGLYTILGRVAESWDRTQGKIISGPSHRCAWCLAAAAATSAIPPACGWGQPPFFHPVSPSLPTQVREAQGLHTYLPGPEQPRKLPRENKGGVISE